MRKIKKSTKSKTLNCIAFIMDILLILIYLPHILWVFLEAVELKAVAIAICKPRFIDNWFDIVLEPFLFMITKHGFILLILFLLWTGLNIYVIFTRKGFKEKLIPVILFIFSFWGLFTAFLCSIPV